MTYALLDSTYSPGGSIALSGSSAHADHDFLDNAQELQRQCIYIIETAGSAGNSHTVAVSQKRASAGRSRTPGPQPAHASQGMRVQRTLACCSLLALFSQSIPHVFLCR